MAANTGSNHRHIGLSRGQMKVACWGTACVYRDTCTDLYCISQCPSAVEKNGPLQTAVPCCVSMLMQCTVDQFRKATKRSWAPGGRAWHKCWRWRERGEAGLAFDIFMSQGFTDSALCGRSHVFLLIGWWDDAFQRVELHKLFWPPRGCMSASGLRLRILRMIFSADCRYLSFVHWCKWIPKAFESAQELSLELGPHFTTLSCKGWRVVLSNVAIMGRNQKSQTWHSVWHDG